jgi:hypothetical protein
VYSVFTQLTEIRLCLNSWLLTTKLVGSAQISEFFSDIIIGDYGRNKCLQFESSRKPWIRMSSVFNLHGSIPELKYGFLSLLFEFVGISGHHCKQCEM